MLYFRRIAYAIDFFKQQACLAAQQNLLILAYLGCIPLFIVLRITLKSLSVTGWNLPVVSIIIGRNLWPFSVHFSLYLTIFWWYAFFAALSRSKASFGDSWSWQLEPRTVKKNQKMIIKYMSHFHKIFLSVFRCVSVLHFQAVFVNLFFTAISYKIVCKSV